MGHYKKRRRLIGKVYDKNGIKRFEEVYSSNNKPVPITINYDGSFDDGSFAYAATGYPQKGFRQISLEAEDNAGNVNRYRVEYYVVTNTMEITAVSINRNNGLVSVEGSIADNITRVTVNGVEAKIKPEYLNRLFVVDEMKANVDVDGRTDLVVVGYDAGGSEVMRIEAKDRYLPVSELVMFAIRDKAEPSRYGFEILGAGAGVWRVEWDFGDGTGGCVDTLIDLGCEGESIGKASHPYGQVGYY